ncbi:TadE family protein [Pirellula staleyi DSM 6068]|uniref:TadE family protein n=1 Tax=Pirellula staleyi (strain ATCC 27377 / DSM 6068 / ICPB 4128) TaxID=530564 RepID=D2R6V5_PIRSD|nr:TadE family protein [Pirellula staleyi]ADB19158.1 TadE family protein [Pirellula staleyi DSM 6068]
MSFLQNFKRSSQRRATATVELAICLPVLVTLIFGALEAAKAIHLQQTATIVAYEVAQAATASGGTSTSAMSQGTSLFTSRSIVGGSINISPAVTNLTAAGTNITVTASIPVNQNSYAFAYIFSGRTLSATVVMQKL